MTRALENETSGNDTLDGTPGTEANSKKCYGNPSFFSFSFATEILYYITIFHSLNNDGWHGEHSITDASISQNLNRVLSKLSKFRQGGSESGVARNLFEAERYVERSVIYFIAFDNAVAVEEVDFVPTHNDRSG